MHHFKRISGCRQTSGLLAVRVSFVTISLLVLFGQLDLILIRRTHRLRIALLSHTLQTLPSSCSCVTRLAVSHLHIVRSVLFSVASGFPHHA